MQLPKINRIRTTNPLAEILERNAAMDADFDAIDAISRLKRFDAEAYEDTEKDIPELIYDILKKEAKPFTRLVKRSYVEEDAWLVRIDCSEGEHLSDHGHEVFSWDGKSEMIPALIEDEPVAMHFVKIHVPRIFVRTLSLPMIEGQH
jgi:hypothetical protein